jgi:hypothetical protein
VAALFWASLLDDLDSAVLQLCSSLAFPSNLSNLSSEREREGAPPPSSPPLAPRTGVGGSIGSRGERGRGVGEGSVGRRGGGGGGVDGGMVAGRAHTGGAVLSDEMTAMAVAGKVLKIQPYSDLI